MTTNFVNDVISFLTNREGNLHEISAAIGMDPNRTSTLLGGLLRSGKVVRSGRRRGYVYALAPDYKTPEETYLIRVDAVLAELKERRRLTYAEIKTLLGTSDCITRDFLTQICRKGNIIKQGKQGYFLTFQDYETYLEALAERRKAKRTADCAARRAARKSQVKPAEPERPAEPVNAITDKCRQNWQGYHIHKIFGSARA
ncbi:hypothetical protein [Atlantibacter hermannii]|uniref:hypothetical protein n=1 Tax=Atlantibacter hermannii TaxID=565 RepID=UPI000EE3E454|nr:hypothetical protein [Atlantibacter hermannii]HAI50279.1 hypothetical protein [Enterobacteriaceae bacterium]